MGGTFIVKAVANKEVVARLEREEKARGEEEANVVVTATRWYNLMVVETEDIRMDLSLVRQYGAHKDTEASTTTTTRGR